MTVLFFFGSLGRNYSEHLDKLVVFEAQCSGIDSLAVDHTFSLEVVYVSLLDFFTEGLIS